MYGVFHGLLISKFVCGCARALADFDFRLACAGGLENGSSLDNEIQKLTAAGCSQIAITLLSVHRLTVRGNILLKCYIDPSPSGSSASSATSLDEVDRRVKHFLEPAKDSFVDGFWLLLRELHGRSCDSKSAPASAPASSPPTKHHDALTSARLLAAVDTLPAYDRSSTLSHGLWELVRLCMNGYRRLYKDSAGSTSTTRPPEVRQQYLDTAFALQAKLRSQKISEPSMWMVLVRGHCGLVSGH